MPLARDVILGGVIPVLVVAGTSLLYLRWIANPRQVPASPASPVSPVVKDAQVLAEEARKTAAEAARLRNAVARGAMSDKAARDEAYGGCLRHMSVQLKVERALVDRSFNRSAAEVRNDGDDELAGSLLEKAKQQLKAEEGLCQLLAVQPKAK